MKEIHLGNRVSLVKRGRSILTNDGVLIAFIIINCITFIVMSLFNAAAATTIFKGLFKYTTGTVSSGNEVSITPAGWTFSTWGIIYAWQALWLVFNVVIIFIDRLFADPPVLTPLFHIFVFINFVLNIIWLFVWDAREFTGSFVILFFMTVALYVATVISHINVYNAEEELPRWTLWLYRILVNNGLAFYATWITVATFLNLAIAITYSWKSQNKSDSGVIGLSLLTVILLVYFILEIYFFEKYLRFTFSPYIQLTIAFAGILSRNWNPNEPAAIFTLVLLVIGPILFLTAKIISTVLRVIYNE